MSFPGAIPTDYTSSASELLSVQAGIGHAALHNYEIDEIIAIATKLGTGASTPVDNTVLKGTGTGTSQWGQLDLESEVTGELPVQNGGTGGATAAEARTNLGVKTLSETLQSVYPVGCIYTETTGINPNTTFGFGTWTAFGSGKVLVGVDTGDADFNTPEETGGSKTSGHTHTLSSAGQALITFTVTTAPQLYIKRIGGLSPSWTATHQNSTSVSIAGSSAAQTSAAELYGTTDSESPSIVQPYITVYFWKRTA